MRTALVLGALLGILAMAVVYAVWAWVAADGGTSITGRGMLAMVLGALGTLGLGIGLMSLVFYSHRHGYDDAVDDWRRPRPRAADPAEDGPEGTP